MKFKGRKLTDNDEKSKNCNVEGLPELTKKDQMCNEDHNATEEELEDLQGSNIVSKRI